MSLAIWYCSQEDPDFELSEPKDELSKNLFLFLVYFTINQTDLVFPNLSTCSFFIPVKLQKKHISLFYNVL